MNTVMLWKEYRQQRSTWIVVTILAVLIAEVLIATTRPFSLHLFQVFSVELLPAIAIVGTTFSYGIISGALLLASEKEDGTLDFLDNLTGRRRSIWRGKFRAGVLLTLSQSLVIAGYFVARGIGMWQVAILLPPLGLTAFAWGILGGALCRHALTAMLTATSFMAACWALTYALDTRPILIIPIELGASVAAVMIARRVFCRSDKNRSFTAPAARRAQRRRIFANWPAVCWLVFQQGRWVILGVTAGVLVIAFRVREAPLIIWPVGSLVLGIACGLVVFCPDQQSGRLFWGAQGLPRGRIWIAKLLVWMAVLAGMLILTWFGNTSKAIAVGEIKAVSDLSSARRPSGSFLEPFSPAVALSSWTGVDVDSERGLDLSLFLTLWPLYGFCIGLFLGQVTRRPVTAVILTVFVAPVVVVLWVPSFLIGGLPLWQVSIVPLMLLLTSRLAMRPWVADRLLNARPLAGIVIASVLMACWVAGCLWYRAVEVPDVGEPFDVQTFRATLESERNNEAGRLIRDALGELGQMISVAEEQLFRSRKSENPFGPTAGSAVHRSKFPRDLGDDFKENRLFLEDAQLTRWINELFESPWFAHLQKAANLPLGVVQQVDRESLEPLPETRHLAKVIELRALQLEARGDLRGALSLFETALGVSRQLENNAPLESYWGGAFLEGIVLGQGLESWLQHAGSDKKLLEAAQQMLQKHVAASPDPANAIKAKYFKLCDLDPFEGPEKPPLDSTYRRLAEEAPWEKERQRRVFRAITLRALQLAHPPFRNGLLAGNNTVDRFALAAEGEGLPPRSGPGSELSAKEWGAFILQSWPVKQSSYQFIEMFAANCAANQQAAQVVVAVRRYHADHGRLPTKLDELVPPYLAVLPMQTGLPTAYYFEETEELVVPVMAASVTALGNPMGQAPLQLASALAIASERFSLIPEEIAGPEGDAAFGGPAMSAGGASVSPLAPRAVIQIGNQTRKVPAGIKR